MTAGEFCVREVDLVQPDETAWQAAVRMRQRVVGSLVALDDARQPIGIITDRDLMERVLAAGKDPSVTLARDVMTPRPTTIAEEQSVWRALELMREGRFRRLPVVDQNGALAGLLTLDDVLMLLAEGMAHIGETVRRETPQGVAEELAASR